MRPKNFKINISSIFLQYTSVRHIFLDKSSVYKSISFNFKRIYECILRLTSLTLIRKVCPNSKLTLRTVEKSLRLKIPTTNKEPTYL